MSRRSSSIATLALLLALTAACTNKKSVNPLANLGSKQPDKILFDKAMDAMRHNRFDVARLTLQTLINTYPDSEYIARAKLAVGDSWYAEGGAASLAQAEQEYSDFEIFFPNMPEAAEAQLKIANIHYQQMEKPDRDFTHAQRAEAEYRKMIMQYPDSKLVPEAKQRLLEVQEVLAEREFEIGRFYYIRESYPASIARLKSLIEKYPLYSGADEALYLLGQDYEGQLTRLKTAPTCDVHGLPRGCITEAAKARYTEEFTKDASEAYDKILTRYPVMDRSDDAKKRLAALHQPIPRPTKAALAENKAEDESRKDSNPLQRILGFVKKGPDTSQAASIDVCPKCDPTLVDPEPVSAKDVVIKETMAATQPAGSKNEASVEIVKPNQPAQADTGASPDTSLGGGSPFGRATSTATASDANELKPTADSNELKPTDSADDASLPPPPPQVNEIQQGQSNSSAAGSSSDENTLASDKDISSSKKKKKKGLKKLLYPF
jgi:outer membrane protein assembly factor BamD